MPPSHPPRRSRTMPAAILAALAVLLLPGCGGDSAPEPQPAPTPTVATNTPTAGFPPAPTPPPRAAAETRAGAIAFVKHYIDLLNHAQSTGDVEPLRAARTDGCEACINVEQGLADVYVRGGSIDGGLWRMVRAISADFNPVEDAWIIGADVRYNEQTVVSQRDADPTHNPGGRELFTFATQRAGDSWQISRWTSAR